MCGSERLGAPVEVRVRRFEIVGLALARCLRRIDVPLSAKNWIVETDWLAEHLNAPDLIVFDGSWHLPTAGRDAKTEYLAEHIPGALFFDIDDLVR